MILIELIDSGNLLSTVIYIEHKNCQSPPFVGQPDETVPRAHVVLQHDQMP